MTDTVIYFKIYEKFMLSRKLKFEKKTFFN